MSEIIDDLLRALGPAPSPRTARFRLAGLVAWDAPEVPAAYRDLVDDATWVAYATHRQLEKVPDLLDRLASYDASVSSCAVPGGRIFFGMAW